MQRFFSQRTADISKISKNVRRNISFIFNLLSETVKGELHLCLKIFIMFDYTF